MNAFVSDPEDRSTGSNMIQPSVDCKIDVARFFLQQIATACVFEGYEDGQKSSNAQRETNLPHLYCQKRDGPAGGPHDTRRWHTMWPHALQHGHVHSTYVSHPARPSRNTKGNSIVSSKGFHGKIFCPTPSLRNSTTFTSFLALRGVSKESCLPHVVR